MDDHDKQIVEAAKGSGDTFAQELVRIIDRLDKQATATLTVLERWVKTFDSWFLTKADYEAIKELSSVVDDTKTLLKEAKEVKDD